MTVWFAAFALGLAGSPHCVAMCGPIALWAHGRSGAAPGGRATLRYHAGRLAMYGAIGAVVGQSGAVAIDAGLGRWLAVAVAVALGGHALIAAGIWRRGATRSSAPGAASRLVASAGAWARRHGLAGPFVVGAITGLLPCGMLYAAVAAAMGLADRFEGAAFMLMFGLGTTPLLAGAVWSGSRIARRVSPAARRLKPVVLLLLAALMLVRALAPSGDITADAPGRTDVASVGRHVH